MYGIPIGPVGRAPSLGTLPGCSRSAPGTLLDTSRATTALHSELMEEKEEEEEEEEEQQQQEDEEEYRGNKPTLV